MKNKQGSEVVVDPKDQGKPGKGQKANV